jgi:hypothetical protein
MLACSVTQPDLKGVMLKLERAYWLIDDVRDKIQTFTEQNPTPFGFTAETSVGEGQTVEYLLRAVIREKPPIGLATVIGDAVQNMRASLDYLVYELAPPEVQKKRKTQFPIFTEESAFKKHAPPMIEGITGDNSEVIERMQPYNQTNVHANDPLAILNKLSNRDKHRLLIPMIAAVNRMSVWVGADNADVRFHFLNGGPIEDGAEITGFSATPHDPAKEMRVEPGSGFQIQIAETGSNMPISAFDLLETIYHHIRHTFIGLWFGHGVMPPTWRELPGPPT